jgi:hypothetical protein
MATYLHYCNLIATYITAFIGVVSLIIIAGYLTVAAIDQWMFLFKLMPLFAEFLTWKDRERRKEGLEKIKRRFTNSQELKND